MLEIKKPRPIIIAGTIIKNSIAIETLAKVLPPFKPRPSPFFINTWDIYLVAEVLGHKDVNTTKKHYAAISDDKRRMAARVVKLRDE